MIMDFSKENEIKRRYLKNDFSDMKRLMSRIRTALVTGKPLTLAGLKLDNIIKFRGDNQDFVISIFQKNVKSIRMISKRKTLEDVLNRIIVRLRAHERFCEFDIKNPASSRILIEWITKKEKTDIKKLHLEGGFDKYRFEAGITGLEAVKDNKSYIWFPTDSPVKNEKNLAPVLANLGDRMGYTNNRGLNTIEKGIEVRKIEDVDFYLLESNAFVTYMDDIIPLYRGNVIYEEYNKDMLFEVFQKSSDYLVSNLKENGQFVYYYNPTADNNIDHEHPSRKEDDLYYNDLRHSGAVIVLIKKYEYTKDEALLEKIKLAINYIISITKFHDDNKAYVYLNQKGKLGGVGISLVMLFFSFSTSQIRYQNIYCSSLLFSFLYKLGILQRALLIQ